MKGRAALVLSLVGVAGAGVAAGLVNDSVLRGDDRSATVVEPPATNPVVEVGSPASTTASASTTSSSVPPSTAPTTIASTSSTVTPTTLGPTTLAPTTVPSGATVQPFTLGEGATVIVDTAEGRLDLVDIEPHPGWDVERIDAPTHSQLVIDLESIAGVQTRFEMSVVHGIVSLHEVPVPPDDDDDSGDGDADDPDDDNSGPGGGGDEPDDDSDDSDHSGSGRSGGDD